MFFLCQINNCVCNPIVCFQLIAACSKTNLCRETDLTGILTSSTSSDKWFKDIAGRGVKGWECYASHYRAQLFRLNADERINSVIKGNDNTIP